MAIKTSSHEIQHAKMARLTLAGEKPDHTPLWSGTPLDFAVFNLMESCYQLGKDCEALHNPFAGHFEI